MTEQEKSSRRTREASVADLITKSVDSARNKGATLHELAERCNLVRPNSKTSSPVISMLKSGNMRLPVDKIPFVSEGLGIDMNDLIYAFLRESVEAVSMRLGETDGPKNYERSWGKMSKSLKNNYRRREEPMIKIFREMEKEIGYELQIDDDFAEKLRELIRNYYTL